uniref:Decapping nuclease n=1 Tax=Tetranychus urticae TaxID=32264 RepID=T1KUE1_TETUR
MHLDNVVLEAPKRLGSFSCYDNNNGSVYCPDKSSLRYLDLPNPVNVDCLQGYDSNVKYGHVISRDMLLLRWVLDNEETMKKFPSDFIVNNGLIKDMNVKCNDNDWNLSAIKIKGKIVLNRNETIEVKEKIARQSERDNQATYAAFNLQRLITKNKNCPKCSSGKENDSLYGVFHLDNIESFMLDGNEICFDQKVQFSKIQLSVDPVFKKHRRLSLMLWNPLFAVSVNRIF